MQSLSAFSSSLNTLLPGICSLRARWLSFASSLLDRCGCGYGGGLFQSAWFYSALQCCPPLSSFAIGSRYLKSHHRGKGSFTVAGLNATQLRGMHRGPRLVIATTSWSEVAEDAVQLIYAEVRAYS